MIRRQSVLHGPALTDDSAEMIGDILFVQIADGTGATEFTDEDVAPRQTMEFHGNLLPAVWFEDANPLRNKPSRVKINASGEDHMGYPGSHHHVREIAINTGSIEQK